MANIEARVIGPGILLCTIRTDAYFMVGAHWKQQLTGHNATQWGRIYMDPDRKAKDRRRREALADWRGIYAGHKDINLDECPGAMFIWEKPTTAHVEPLCAVSNQEFGRDMYAALHEAVKTAMIKSGTWEGRPKGYMGWWEVRFAFVG